MGQFSWITQDTDEQIFNDYDKQEIHMVDPRDGTDYVENDYEGYGVFGGRDFYELMADINKDFLFKKFDFDINWSFDYYRTKRLAELYKHHSGITMKEFKEILLKEFSLSDKKEYNIDEFDTLFNQRFIKEFEDLKVDYENTLKLFNKPWKDLTDGEIQDKRGYGIDLWFDYIEPSGYNSTTNKKPSTNEEILTPILVEDYNKWTRYKGQNPESDQWQGWHTESGDEDEW